MSQRAIEELPRDDCFALLGREVVGRLAFVDDDGPGAVPVNYGMVGEQIVLRVEPGSHLRTVLGPAVGFEVDHLEPGTGSGWSVLVRGASREVPIDDVPALVRQMHDDGRVPGPWAEGVHNVWVVISPTLVTGRRLTAPYIGTVF